MEAVAPRSRLSRLFQTSPGWSSQIHKLIVPSRSRAPHHVTVPGFLFPTSVICNPRGAKPLRNGRPANSDSFFGGAFPTLLLLVSILGFLAFSWVAKGCQEIDRYLYDFRVNSLPILGLIRTKRTIKKNSQSEKICCFREFITHGLRHNELRRLCCADDDWADPCPVSQKAHRGEKRAVLCVRAAVGQ